MASCSPRSLSVTLPPLPLDPIYSHPLRSLQALPPHNPSLHLDLKPLLQLSASQVNFSMKLSILFGAAFLACVGADDPGTVQGARPVETYPGDMVSNIRYAGAGTYLVLLQSILAPLRNSEWKVRPPSVLTTWADTTRLSHP